MFHERNSPFRPQPLPVNPAKAPPPPAVITDLGFLPLDPSTSAVRETLEIIGCIAAAILIVMGVVGACLFNIGG